MARILVNPEYAPGNDPKQTGKYLFEGDNGTVTPMWVWPEKSKASEAHPNGKPWIRSKEMSETTNRDYFSEDLFIASDKGQGVIVEVKTTGKRTLGGGGVSTKVLKGLQHANPEAAVEYEQIVNTAVETFKAQKTTTKRKKPEEMTEAELVEYITALREGRKVTIATGPRSFLDMMDETTLDRYNELVAEGMAVEVPRAKAGPLTEEQKAARAAKRTATEINKGEALLAALRGQAPAPAPAAVVADDEDDSYDEDSYDEDEDN